MREVVAAVIPGGDGTFLIQQRVKQHGAGKWELPGGKVQEGESLGQALVREIKEELGVLVIPRTAIHEYTGHYGWGSFHVTFFFCPLSPCRCLQPKKHVSGLEGQPIAWIRPSQHKDYDTFEGESQVFAMILADEGAYR